MLFQAGLFAEVFQQVFQAARRPRKDGIARSVLRQVFAVTLHPFGRQVDFAFFIARPRGGITDEKNRAVGAFQVNVVDIEGQALAFFDARGQQEHQQRVRAGVRFFGNAVFVRHFDDALLFLRGQDNGQRAHHRLLQNLLGRVGRNPSALRQPAKESLDRCDSPRQALGAARDAAAILEPLQKLVEIFGGDCADRAVGGHVRRQQLQIAHESFDRVGRPVLVEQVHFPGANGGEEWSVRGDVCSG
jgi:hypothetical protein